MHTDHSVTRRSPPGVMVAPLNARQQLTRRPQLSPPRLASAPCSLRWAPLRASGRSWSFRTDPLGLLAPEAALCFEPI